MNPCKSSEKLITESLLLIYCQDYSLRYNLDRCFGARDKSPRELPKTVVSSPLRYGVTVVLVPVSTCVYVRRKRISVFDCGSVCYDLQSTEDVRELSCYIVIGITLFVCVKNLSD